MIYQKPSKDEKYKNLSTGVEVTVITVANSEDDQHSCHFSPEVVVYDDGNTHRTCRTENFVDRFKRV